MKKFDNKLYIEQVQLIKEVNPLIKPYKLSFNTLTEFISIQTQVTFSNQKTTLAEVVPLLGYNDESEKIVQQNLTSWIPQLIGKSIDEARETIRAKINKAPFSTSPILTALDLYTDPLPNKLDQAIDFVIPTVTSNLAEATTLLQQDKHIKVKLTGDVAVDGTFFERLKPFILAHPHTLRLDANQAYSYEDASKFFELLLSQEIAHKVSYVEQPMKVGKEEEMGRLRQAYPNIEIMFDESVVTAQDLENAHALGIGFVKFKLFKQGGVEELIQLAKRAKELGIKVILGNGVATSIANDVENNIYLNYSDLFEYPLESNGFLKVKHD